jgi:hypothetical protein
MRKIAQDLRISLYSGKLQNGSHDAKVCDGSFWHRANPSIQTRQKPHEIPRIHSFDDLDLLLRIDATRLARWSWRCRCGHHHLGRASTHLWRE